MTAPSIRKIFWGKRGGLGQDGQGVRVGSGPFGAAGGGEAGEQESGLPVREGAEVFRDLDQLGRSAVRLQLLPELEAKYVEPFPLRLRSEPAGIICLRVLDVLQPDIPVHAGGTCHFLWDGQQANISSIDGLSTGDRAYRFSFLVVG